MTTKIFFAGFGGQGILFAGKFLAYKGLIENMYLSWLPSYGPEMRGGTANCSVTLSDDEPIGSPIFADPDVLVVMNQPSLDKFEDSVVPGGMILVDSTQIARKVKRTDVKVFYIPATQMATDGGMTGLANMILTGKLIRECSALNAENCQAALEKIISARHADKLELNLSALKCGLAYEE